MTEAIVTYLNAVIDTIGRVDQRYCLAELRSDGTTTVPYVYVGTGNVQPVNIDGGSLSYWRNSDPISFEPIEAQYGSQRLSGTYSLRLVVTARRKDSTADDGFMPTRLAEDIANAFTGTHNDLKVLLKANSVSVRVSSIDTDITRVWAAEFQGTGVSDPNYTRVMFALNVGVTVIGDRRCWESECEYDPDILHLFDFCKAGTVARLTPAQIACLETAICETPPTLCEQLAEVQPDDVVADVFDCLTEAAQDELLASECVIPPCPDGTVNITNTAATPIASVTVASGGVEPYVIPNVAWTQSDGSPQSTAYGDTITCTPQIQDLTIRIEVALAADAFTFTATANEAGSITSVNDGSLTSFVLSVNATPVTAPFSIANGDTVSAAFDAAGSATTVTLTGTY